MKQETTMQTTMRRPAGQAWLTWIGGAALGAVTMYLSDPDRGKRRRALARDKMISVANRAGDVLDVASRDVGNRMQGLRAEAARMLFQRDKAIDDPVLVERVRSRIGRAISHPHPIYVIARQGRITLSGPVLVHERMPLLEAVKAVPGVLDVEDLLQEHQNAQGIPSLQGEGRPRQNHAAPYRNWPPGLRAAAMLGGGALGVYGLSRRAPAGVLLGALGMGLMARGISRQPFSGVTAATRPRAVELQKSIHIAAPPETVFDLWSRYENFPHFMSNVIEVQDRGEGRSHWTVSGPAGIRIEWNASLTASERPRVLAWKTDPDSTVDHAGTIHFEPVDGGTRVSVHMSYIPPAGALGHAIASLFNGDPERQMEEDLLHMKEFIESGRRPPDAAQPAQPAQPGQVLH
jgi:uncharacterized membrane protein